VNSQTLLDYLCPFSVLQAIHKIAWSKGDNSSELSNFDAIVKKNADCRQKEKKKGGDEEGRSSLMPKPNDIHQQVYIIFHPSENCVNL